LGLAVPPSRSRECKPDRRRPSSPSFHDYGTVWIHFSNDDGRTWSEASVLSSDHRGETAILRLRPDRWLAASRIERGPDEKTPALGLELFVSEDDGRTWHPKGSLTSNSGGYAGQHPGHLLRLKDGRILLTYGMRDVGAIGIRVSDDEGQTWRPGVVLQRLGRGPGGYGVGDTKGDLGYPATVQLSDGSLVTAYYYSKPAYHMGVVRWSLEAAGGQQNGKSAPAARILLWPDTAPVGDGTREPAETVMTVFLPPPKKATGAAVVICPGGGYIRHVLDREGPIVARWLTEHGIAGIVLEYRLPHGRPYVPLLDAQRAIRTVRSNAEAWNLDLQRIGIMGFSAGGHLASTAGTHFDGGDPKATDSIDRESCRPDFMVLVYPVVTMGEKTHKGSKRNLLGPDPKPELIQLFSNEEQVTDQTPPTFLAHAKDDVPVPPENSRALRDALKTHGVAVEYLELPSGGHGLYGCKGPMWEAWKKRALEWMAAQAIIPKGEEN